MSHTSSSQSSFTTVNKNSFHCHFLLLKEGHTNFPNYSSKNNFRVQLHRRREKIQWKITFDLEISFSYGIKTRKESICRANFYLKLENLNNSSYRYRCALDTAAIIFQLSKLNLTKFVHSLVGLLLFVSMRKCVTPLSLVTSNKSYTHTCPYSLTIL